MAQLSMQAINEAYGRMLKGDEKYRFVVDMATLQHDQKAA